MTLGGLSVAGCAPAVTQTSLDAGASAQVDAGPDGSLCVPVDAGTYPCAESLATYCDGGERCSYEQAAQLACGSPQPYRFRCGDYLFFPTGGVDGWTQVLYDAKTHDVAAVYSYSANFGGSFYCNAGPAEFAIPVFPNQADVGTRTCDGGF